MVDLPGIVRVGVFQLGGLVHLPAALALFSQPVLHKGHRHRHRACRKNNGKIVAK